MAEMVTKLCKGCQQVKPCWKTRSTYCTDCCKQYNREWERKHPDKVKARSKAKAADLDHQQHVSTYRKIKRRTDTAFRTNEILKNRAAKLQRKFGMTLEQLEEMTTAQNNRCAICGDENQTVRMGRQVDLVVDHDHETGLFVGCSAINAILA
jgi:recombination endonuclease VII